MIRLANKFDIDDIIKLLKEFAIESDNPLTFSPLNWSKNYVETVIANILAGRGFCLIDDEKTGILIAIKSQCFWVQNEWQLQEVMLHSKSKILMYRLIKEYAKIARDMIANNEITHAVICSYKDNKFERLGMTKTEIHWSIE